MILFLVKNPYFAGFLKNLLSAAVILHLSYSYNVQDSMSYSRVGVANMLYMRISVGFWAFEGFRTRLIIPVISKNVVNLLWHFFVLYTTV